MKILMVNVHSDANAGDAVLNHAAVDLLAEAFPAAEIRLAMNDPASQQGHPQVAAVVPSFTYWVKDGRGWRVGMLIRILLASVWFVLRHRWQGKTGGGVEGWRPLLQAYAEADLVVSCPGNFLYSSGVIGLPFWLNVYTMGYGVFLGKPLYMMPQTLGPLRRRREKWLTGWILSKMRLAFVRDALSLELVENELNVGHDRVYLVPDVAFGFKTSEAHIVEAQALLERYGVAGGEKGLLGVTLINWGAQNRLFTNQDGYEAGVAAGIRRFVQEVGGDVVLFSQVQGPQAADDDRIPAARVYGLVGDVAEDVTFIEEGVAPAVLKAAYRQMDLLMGSRLHSNIFALSTGTPVVALQYQYKTRGVMRMVGLEEWVLPLEEVSAERLPLFLLDGWRNRREIEREIELALPRLHAEIGTIGRQIAEDFARSRR